MSNSIPTAPAVTINETKSNGSGTKAFAGVIGLLLVIAGVYSMVEPMNQRIDFLQQAISAQKLEYDKKIDKMEERERKEKDKTNELAVTNAVQKEKILQLERQVHNKANKP